MILPLSLFRLLVWLVGWLPLAVLLLFRVMSFPLLLLLVILVRFAAASVVVVVGYFDVSVAVVFDVGVGGNVVFASRCVVIDGVGV